MGIDPSGVRLSEERILIERIKDGERSSFDKLVEAYKHRGLGIAYGMVGNLEDAQDVLQEAFVKVYLNINGFREQSRFSTWFYRIIVNCALDYLRKRKKMQRVFMEPLVDEEGKEKEIQVADTRFEPGKIVMAKEFNLDLDNCIANLSEKQRTCFVLKHQNGLDIAEIAQVLKCRPSTVKVHLFRAVYSLKKQLSKYLD